MFGTLFSQVRFYLGVWALNEAFASFGVTKITSFYIPIKEVETCLEKDFVGNVMDAALSGEVSDVGKGRKRSGNIAGRRS